MLDDVVVLRKWWTQRRWPVDAERDERFLGLNGSVAEVLRGEIRVGFAMMTVQQWATETGFLWRKRLTDVRDLPELNVVFDKGADEVQEWFAHDHAEATRVYQECVVAGRLEWDDGATFELRWLDEDTSAKVRAERFWEPAAD